MNKAPLQLATLCYLKQNGHTLMIHRNKRPDDFHWDKWNGVGGKCEPGEAPYQCALREIEEETGLLPTALIPHGYLMAPLFDTKKDWLIYIYSCTTFTGSLIDPPEGTLHWVPDAEVLTKNLWEGDRHFIPWIMEQRMFESTFYYEQGEYIRHEVGFL